MKNFYQTVGIVLITVLATVGILGVFGFMNWGDVSDTAWQIAQVTAIVIVAAVLIRWVAVLDVKPKAKK